MKAKIVVVSDVDIKCFINLRECYHFLEVTEDFNLSMSLASLHIFLLHRWDEHFHWKFCAHFLPISENKNNEMLKVYKQLMTIYSYKNKTNSFSFKVLTDGWFPLGKSSTYTASYDGSSMSRGCTQN